MASVLGGDIIASFLSAISPGKYVKVLVGLSAVVSMQSLKLHEVYLHLFRLFDLNSKQMQKVVHQRGLPHAVEDFIPLIQKSFDVVVFELNLVEMGDIQKIRIFFIFLKPSKENDKYLSSF